MDTEEVRGILKDLILKEKIQIYDDYEKLDQFIVNESAKREVGNLTDQIVQNIENHLKSELERTLPPSFEMVHVREQGLRIWGKAENVAFGKNTIVEIFESFRNAINPEEFDSIMYMTGRKAALSFFDQFREIIKVDSTRYVPSSIHTFLNWLSTFDQRSAWWEELQYGESDADILSITIKKPFWRYPWFDTDNHYYDHYFGGYLLSLYNCCFDYLHTLSTITDRTFRESFAVEIIPYKEKDATKTYFGLKRTIMKIDDFENISRAIYLLVEWILFRSIIEDGREHIFDTIDLIIKEIEEMFNTTLDIDKKFYQDLKASHSRHHPEFVRNALYKLLNSIRIQFEDIRIDSLNSISLK